MALTVPREGENHDKICGGYMKAVNILSAKEQVSVFRVFLSGFIDDSLVFLDKMCVYLLSTSLVSTDSAVVLWRCFLAAHSKSKH